MTPKSTIFSLLLIMLVDHTSLNITGPILTLLFFDVHSSLFSIDATSSWRSTAYGLCIALPRALNMIATPILSIYSDVIGRKKILLLGILGAFLFALTAAFGILLGSLSLIVLACVIQGTLSRTNPIAQAIIGDTIAPEKKIIYMGYLQTAISIGAFIGPLLGGYLANKFFFHQLNFSLPYLVAAILALLAWILTLLLLKETLPQPAKHSSWRNIHWQSIQQIVTQPNILSISLILLFIQISWGTYYQFIPPILKTVLNFNAHQLGLFIGLLALWLAIATTVGLRLLDQFFNTQQILFIAIYLVFFGLLITAVACATQTVMGIWLGAIPVAMGDVIAFTCLIALYSDVGTSEEQGKIMGICFVIISLVWASCGALGGIAMGFHPLLPLLIAPLGALSAIILLHCNCLPVFNQTVSADKSQKG